jgi:hypothetical protein
MALFAAGDRAGALRAIADLPESLPSPVAALVAAVVLADAGRTDEARAALARATRLRPHVLDHLGDGCDRWCLDPAIAARAKAALEPIGAALRREGTAE